MSKPQQLMSCLALSLAGSLITLEAWQRQIIRIDANAGYYCLVEGAERDTHGTRISLQIKSTSLVWLRCSSR